jgi:hypothetical protein
MSDYSNHEELEMEVREKPTPELGHSLEVIRGTCEGVYKIETIMTMLNDVIIGIIYD